MKSLRILAPWGFLIICGLSEWSQSHPTPDWEGGLESITRDMNDNDKGCGVKAVFADAHSGHEADPLLKTASFVNNRVGAQNAKTTTETQKVAEDSQDFKSLAGQVETMSPNKVSQPAKVAEGKNQTFRGKFRTIFLSWPVKFWESIKNWFSKFFQSGDKNLINPAKDAKGFQTNLKEEPIPNTVKGVPTLSEVSKIKIPAQEPIKSTRGSNNLNKMTRQAPVGKGQFYTTPLDDPQVNPTAPLVAPNKQNGPFYSSAHSEDPNTMPIARPHDSRSNFAQPRNQFTSDHELWGQFSSDHIPAAAQGMWGPMAEMENMMGQVATHSTPGSGKKQVWNDLDGHYQFTPQGKDGSGMEHINLSQKKVEVVPDPVKGTTISMSTSSMKSSSQGVQSLFPNFGGPRAGSNEALPYHAIDHSKMSANMDPIVSVHNKFTPAPKKPTAQNFHVSFSSGPPKKPPSQTKNKVNLVEIDDDPPQEVKKPVPSKPRQQKLKITEQKPTMSSSTQLENQDSNESHIKESSDDPAEK